MSSAPGPGAREEQGFDFDFDELVRAEWKVANLSGEIG